MEELMCIHCIVKGKVQGVWYRQSAVDKALELKITGWVKNNDRGEVELMACGLEDDLDLLRQWLWQGPPLAKVTEVLIQSMPVENFPDFRIQN